VKLSSLKYITGNRLNSYRADTRSKAVDYLAKYLERIKESLYARCDEVSSFMWSNSSIVSAIKENPNPVVYYITFGPYLDINDFESLARLAQANKKFEFYLQGSRDGRHYKVFDDFCVFVEDPHPPLATQRDGIFLEDYPQLIQDYKYQFQNSVKTGEWQPVSIENIDKLDLLKPIVGEGEKKEKWTKDELQSLKDRIMSAKTNEVEVSAN